MGVLVKGCNIKHHESRTNNNLMCQLFRCQQQREVLSHLSFLLWDELRIINQHVPRAAKGPPQSLFEVLMPMRSEFSLALYSFSTLVRKNWTGDP